MNKLSLEQEIELEAEIAERIEQCYAIAEEHYGREFKRCSFDFTVKGKKAGLAQYYRNNISLNWELLLRNKEEFFKQTIPHEIAHLLAHILHPYRISAHGREWQSVMTWCFELEPLRCHSMDVTATAVRKYFPYTCDCKKKFSISSVRHNRIVKGARYKCNACNSVIFMDFSNDN